MGTVAVRSLVGWVTLGAPPVHELGLHPELPAVPSSASPKPHLVQGHGDVLGSGGHTEPGAGPPAPGLVPSLGEGEGRQREAVM